ncbi:hypothetical protein L9F63_027938, partial [Diploptera punctata]
VVERLSSIDHRYKELLELAKLRKQRLLDALSLYKLLSESDGVEQWIGEKDRMLQTMVPAKDIEDVEIMKHRYDGFEKEMNANASRVAVVNQLARQLLHVEHPNSEQIVARQNQLNHEWADLREKAEAKRDELNSAHGVQTFHIECRETLSWIEDKKRILQSTDSLEMDLTGIMTLQRRLSGMGTRPGSYPSKMDSLEQEADSIGAEHPDEGSHYQRENTTDPTDMGTANTDAERARFKVGGSWRPAQVPARLGSFPGMVDQDADRCCLRGHSCITCRG